MEGNNPNVVTSRHSRIGFLLLMAILILPALTGAQSVEAIRTVPVRGNIYLLAGAGANIALSVGPQGVLLVDTGAVGMSMRVLAAVRELNQLISTSGRPPVGGVDPVLSIAYVLNTSARTDHVGGNAAVAADGRPGANLSEFGAGGGLSIFAHERVLQHMSDAKFPSSGYPTLTYLGSTMKLSRWFNGEGIEMIHLPAAVTDGDSIVHFRGSDVIAAGDIFDMSRYPLIGVKDGGTIQGEIAALNRLLDLMIPDDRSEGGTLLIPARGRICDVADLAYYRNMVTEVRDRVQAMIRKGMTLEQIQKARPTEDWDPRFGTDSSWTPAQFVDSVFATLKQDAVHAGK
jgi:cyclase